MTCLSEAKGLAWTRSASKDVFEGSEPQLQLQQRVRCRIHGVQKLWLRLRSRPTCSEQRWFSSWEELQQSVVDPFRRLEVLWS